MRPVNDVKVYRLRFYIEKSHYVNGFRQHLERDI